jgi:3-deoxy-D-manno-octulosonic acid kinase
MTIQTKIVDNQYIIYHEPLNTKNGVDCDVKSDVKSDLRLLDGSLFNSLFNPEYLLDQKKVYRQAMGRGQTYFFKHKQKDYVLKHYWRGGLVGKLNADFYFWNPFQNKHSQLQQTRAYQEFILLTSLNALKLPAPAPIAARISYSIFGYRADIITATLANTQSLVQLLTKNLADNIWFDIGTTIAKFHRQNIYHDDLNANNILIDDCNKIFIIDFDKGKIIDDIMAGPKKWKKQNLQRFLRSLNKEKAKNTKLYFSNENWQQLLKGYQ